MPSVRWGLQSVTKDGQLIVVISFIHILEKLILLPFANVDPGLKKLNSLYGLLL